MRFTMLHKNGRSRRLLAGLLIAGPLAPGATACAETEPVDDAGVVEQDVAEDEE